MTCNCLAGALPAHLFLPDGILYGLDRAESAELLADRLLYFLLLFQTQGIHTGQACMNSASNRQGRKVDHIEIVELCEVEDRGRFDRGWDGTSI